MKKVTVDYEVRKYVVELINGCKRYFFTEEKCIAFLNANLSVVKDCYQVRNLVLNL